MKKYTKILFFSVMVVIAVYSIAAIFYNDFRSLYYDIEQKSIVEWNGIKFNRHHGMYYRDKQNIIGIHIVGDEWKGGAFIKIEPKFSDPVYIINSFRSNKGYELLSIIEEKFKGEDAIHAIQRDSNDDTLIISFIIPSRKIIIGIAAKQNFIADFEQIINEMQLI